MTQYLSVDDLIVNLLALAEVVPRLTGEHLTELAGYAPQVTTLVTEIDVMVTKLIPSATGDAPQVPDDIWDQLKEICDKDLKLLTGRIAVALYSVPGFRIAAQAWTDLRPERVNLSNESLAQRDVQAEPRPVEGVVGLNRLGETVLGRMRRLVELTRLALERPEEFATWTDQLRWLAGLLKREWPRPDLRP
jgi:hypothetical protein